MKLRTSGKIRRLDLEPIWSLLPALQAAWAGLSFGPDGRVLHGITGEPQDAFSLIEGAHRSAGARYRVLVARPVPGVPGVPPVEGVEPEMEDVPYLVTLRRDDGDRIDIEVTGEREHWSFELEIDLAARRVEVDGRVDLTAVLRADGSPGCVAGWLGGTGTGRASIDGRALDDGGPLVEATGSASRFRGEGAIEVDPSLARWRIEGRARVRARGIGRLVLWIGGRRARREVEEQLAEAWASADRWGADAARQLDELRRSIEEEGGPEGFVRMAIWEPERLER